MQAEAPLTVSFNTSSITEQYVRNEDILEDSREIGLPGSPRFVRPKLRRVVPQTDLRHNFDTPDSSLNSSEGNRQPTYTPSQGQQILLFPNSTEKPETTELQHDENESDGASTKSANYRTSELVVESRQQGHKHDLADLEEDHEDKVRAIKARHLEEIQAAGAKILVLQQRVEDLESFKLTMKVDLEEKEVAVQHLLAGTQSLQERNDKLKEQCDLLSAESEQLQRSALAEIEERREVQQGLEEAFNAKDALARDLARAQNQARYFEHRMIGLTNALGETPNEVANMSGVIDQKDKMFSDLEMRAGECFTALTKLEEQRSQEGKIARREMASLEAELGQNEKTIERLRKSKDSFQNQCEAVLLMLCGKVRGVDLINAMDEYFQTAVEDNSCLTNEVKRLDSALSGKDLKIASLEIAIRESEKSLEEEKHSGDELRLALSTKGTELGDLEAEIQLIKTDHQSVIDKMEGRVADAEQAYSTTLELMDQERDERERHFIQTKDDKIATLEQTCRDLSTRREYLEQCLWTQTNTSTENARAACIHAAHAEESLVQWIAAQAEIEDQREELRAWLGLPASIDIAEVLATKKALGEAQSRIQELENDRRGGRHRVGESSGSYGVDDDELYGISDEEGKTKEEEEIDDEESNDVGW